MDCKHIAARCSKSPPYSSLSISIVVLSSFNTPRPLLRESMFARVKWIARDKALTIFVHNLLQYELPVATHIAIDYCQYLMARTKALLYGNKEILHPKTRSCLAESVPTMFTNIPSTYLNNSLPFSLVQVFHLQSTFFRFLTFLPDFGSCVLIWPILLIFLTIVNWPEAFVTFSFIYLKIVFTIYCVSSCYFLPCFLALFRFILPLDMFRFPFKFLPHVSQVHSCFGFPSSTSRHSFHLWAQCCNIISIVLVSPITMCSYSHALSLDEALAET